MIIYPTELIALGLWLLAPALALGLLVLYAVHARFGARMGLRPWRAASLLVVFGIGLAAMILVYAPAEMVRPLGLRDIRILGWQTYWAPVGFVAELLALPLALVLGRGR
ncbi:hypothetical protein PMI14_01208 [Acidovorax sp. CF316]|uniref:hypothetical protein n=1 Tax=Acidovorax sp. CF316 TaxID=1144317 RepID=UPI00026BDAB9|nr:hypothetical protein [Acidovorax sp. CF316]EJE53907.1 hypothetical protein PMI14_01208 [Acidovorax sp. CF316]